MSKGGRFTRRDFLRGASTALMAGTGVPLIGCGSKSNGPVDGGGGGDAGGRRQLRILTWNNFVPQLDVWLDPFAQSWGEANRVDVSVDHVPVTMIPGLFQAELDAGEGHDLIEFVSAPANYEPVVADLTDVNMEAISRFGAQEGLCRASSFNPVTSKYFGFCHGWLPDPGVYRRSLWDMAGLPNGPRTYQQLLEQGEMVRSLTGVPVGLGIAPEIDSNMALRALLWSYGGAVQNASSEVVINSAETIEAIEYAVELYQRALPEDVLTWNPATNNDQFIAGTASYILNSVSVYRTAQTTARAVADDTFFTPALMGPRASLVGPHGVITYVIPQHSPNINAAKDFLLGLVEHYNEAVYASRLFYFPAFPDTTPQLVEADGWLDSDPFESTPRDKLAVLKDATSWSVPLGYPGNANPAVGEVFGAGTVPQMFAHAVSGSMTPAEAAAWGEDQIGPIFERWRATGLL